ncbi:MAG: molybdenum cofactor guanylyltransferase [Candidatus Lokiarchaeota archaeon]|nr:molybdenum cofactor guanylyltransferase [Candidatus Lokiarchaeota archaeon]
MSKIRNKSESIAIMILIGGKSTRFGSDKGLFEFLGKPLISYQLETLSPLNYDIFIVAHSKNQVSRYLRIIDITKIMAFIIDDNNITSDSPLRIPLLGLYSGFKELYKLGYKKSFVISCDLPLIQFNVLKFLIKQSNGFDCCIPKWNNNFMEPLCAIYPIRKVFQKAKENMENSDYKLTNLLDKNWKINYLSIEELIKPLDQKLLTFININKFEDIETLKKLYKN